MLQVAQSHKVIWCVFLWSNIIDEICYAFIAWFGVDLLTSRPSESLASRHNGDPVGGSLEALGTIVL